MVRTIQEIYDVMLECEKGIISINYFMQSLGAFGDSPISSSFIENRVQEKMKLLKRKKRYEDIFGRLELLKYILENTSLMHLVYTNNNGCITRLDSMNFAFQCPFHRDKKVSMVVSLDKNIFSCSDSEVPRNQLDYLMKYEKLTYQEAFYLLAFIYGIEFFNNPFKEEKYKKLVDKYQNSLISNEYKQFLIASYATGGENGEDVRKLYRNLLQQVDKVHRKIKDSNFVYEKIPSKHQYKMK